jgi:hypothetical protein
VIVLGRRPAGLPVVTPHYRTHMLGGGTDPTRPSRCRICRLELELAYVYNQWVTADPAGCRWRRWRDGGKLER